MDESSARRLLEERGYGVIPPEQYLSDLEDSFFRIWKRVKPYTMTSPERGYALYRGVRHLVEEKIPGALAECGVWKGGSCMLMALALSEAEDQGRSLYLYDTFQGMTPPGKEDRIAWNGASLQERWLRDSRGGSTPFADWAVGMEEVRENLAKTDYPREKFCLVPGPVEETLEGKMSHLPESLALLRLDTDWYASTKVELEVLYPRLVPGGILIIDDYGHFQGARTAVDEYFSGLPAGEAPLLHRIDYTGRGGIKPTFVS